MANQGTGVDAIFKRARPANILKAVLMRGHISLGRMHGRVRLKPQQDNG